MMNFHLARNATGIATSMNSFGINGARNMVAMGRQKTSIATRSPGNGIKLYQAFAAELA